MAKKQTDAEKTAAALAWVNEQTAEVVLVDALRLIQAGGNPAPFGFTRLQALVDAGHLQHLSPEIAPQGCYLVVKGA